MSLSARGPGGQTATQTDGRVVWAPPAPSGAGRAARRRPWVGVASRLGRPPRGLEWVEARGLASVFPSFPRREISGESGRGS